MFVRFWPLFEVRVLSTAAFDLRDVPLKDGTNSRLHRAPADNDYCAQATESTFKIIAAYSGSDPKAPKRITIDETMPLTSD
jgi:hypothetical protein